MNSVCMKYRGTSKTSTHCTSNLCGIHILIYEYILITNYLLPNYLSFSFVDLPPTEPSEFAGICPLDQYNPVPSKNSVWLPYKGYCYKFVAEMKRWSEAATNCLKHGEFEMLHLCCKSLQSAKLMPFTFFRWITGQY